MIHLKYKCKVNFVKLSLIWIDLCLKLVFENATAGRNTGCRSVVNCASCSLHRPLIVSDAACGIQNATKQCNSPSHLHTVNNFFHPSPYTIIQWAKVWRPGWPFVGTAISDPSLRETIVQEISNFAWKMRRSSVMLEINTTSFIQKHIPQKSGQFLLQKSEVRLSCKTTFQDERTSQLIVQNCTPHIDTKSSRKLFSTVAWGFLSAHTWELCVLLTPSRLNCASSVNRM